MTNPAEILEAQKSSKIWFLIYCSLTLFFQGMGVGSGLGYAGLVMPDHTKQNSTLLPLTVEQSTWFMSVTPLAMTLGVILSIPTSEFLGRKHLFIVSNILSIAGYTIIYLATSFGLLVAGRIVQCFGMGLGAMTVGVFLSEITTVRMRGPLIGVSQTAVCAGLLLSTAVCVVLPIEFLSLVLAMNSLVILLLLVIVPRSPQWLVRKDKDGEARASLLRLRGKHYTGVELELTEIKEVINQKQGEDKVFSLKTVTDKTFSTPLMVFSVLFVVLAMGGNDTLVFFGPTIFEQINIGISPKVLATLPWFGFSFGYAVSSPLMARVNRRPQFILCSAVMSLSLSALATSLLYLGEGVENSMVLPVLLISTLQIATVAYGMGVGAIPYTMVGEVFTPHQKTLGSCIVQSVRSVVVFMLLKIIPTLIDNIGLHGLFYMHSGVLAFAVVFAYLCLPETRGKTLTELSSLYRKEHEAL